MQFIVLCSLSKLCIASRKKSFPSFFFFFFLKVLRLLVSSLSTRRYYLSSRDVFLLIFICWPCAYCLYISSSLFPLLSPLVSFLLSFFLSFFLSFLKWLFYFIFYSYYLLLFLVFRRHWNYRFKLSAVGCIALIDRRISFNIPLFNVFINWLIDFRHTNVHISQSRIKVCYQ